MNLEIPPILFYALGVMLVGFGGLRAYFFGWRKREKNIDEGLMPRSRDQKRHIMWGIIWVIMGLFLLVSTLNAQRRLG